ncbi:MAG: phosphatidylglycerophosphatase A [Gammaproteobacteria bacterium]|nr:MAG: phosphatidylglycerophosphatase A [Gammaproteobacteria bacterium]
MSSVPRGSLKNPIHFLALGFGSGMAPKAPGTFGTLAAVPIVAGLSLFSSSTYLIALLVVTVSGFWICGKTAKDWGVHDHSAIVWDEIAGFMLTMLWVPVSWTSLIVGFALFRLFDIAKPYPISWLDKNVSGGTGIMVDDLLAGIFAGVLLQLFLFVI